MRGRRFTTGGNDCELLVTIKKKNDPDYYIILLHNILYYLACFIIIYKIIISLHKINLKHQDLGLGLEFC